MLPYTLANENSYETSLQTLLNLFYLSSVTIGVD